MRRPDLRPTLKAALLTVLRAGLPVNTNFWDGVAWFARMTLIGVHLAFALPALPPGPEE